LFELKHPESILWPVTVHRPADKGETESHTFYVRFKPMGRKEFDTESQDDDAFWAKVILGWEGLPEPFSEEARVRMLDLQWMKVGLSQAYLNCINGRRQKN